MQNIKDKIYILKRYKHRKSHKDLPGHIVSENIGKQPNKAATSTLREYDHPDQLKNLNFCFANSVQKETDQRLEQKEGRASGRRLISTSWNLRGLLSQNKGE